MEQRIVEVASRLPAYGAVTGWAALRLQGARFHDGLLDDGRTQVPVTLAVGTRGWVRRRQDAAYSFEALDAAEIVVRRGVRVTEPVRATFDAMRRTGDLRDAVVELEKSVMARIVSVEELCDYVEVRRGSRRIALVREAVVLASEHGRSPRETRVRLVAELDLGWRGLLVNPTVTSSTGAFLGEADLVDPAAGLVVEYNGAEHEKTARRHRDAEKLAAFRASGLEVVMVTDRMLGQPDRLRDVLGAGRERALETPPERKAFRVEPRARTLHQELLEARAVAAFAQQWEG